MLEEEKNVILEERGNGVIGNICEALHLDEV